MKGSFSHSRLILSIMGMLTGMAAPAAAQGPAFYSPQWQSVPQQQPYQQAYEQQAQVFPRLPPSRACTENDLPGMWKLQMVYEKPVGPDMTDFVADPVQYLVFNGDHTYGEFKAGRRNVSPFEVRNAVAGEQRRVLQQYLVDASGAGFVYFYRNRQAISTQACFIVAVRQEPFSPGEMLLMPPEGQSAERLLKVYARVNERRPNPRRNRGRR